MSAIKFFYFDLGNVLVDFSVDMACTQLAQVLEVAPAEVSAELFEKGLQTRYETGEISTVEFCEFLNIRWGRGKSVAEIERAASDMFALNHDTLHLARQIKQAGIPIGILSNTCPAHWEFLAAGMLRDWLGEFDHVVLSYEEKVMKPHRDIYDAASSRSQTHPSQIMFVDDRMENVVGARQAGLVAEPFLGALQLRQQLQDRGVCLN